MSIQIVQALRAIAALLVVSVHLGNPDGFEVKYLHASHPITAALSAIGYFGVDLFFAISGFIMIVTSLRSDGTSLTAGEFLRRRVVRIYPPLWVINTLVLGVYVIAPNLVNAHGGDRPNVLASYLLLPQSGRPLVLVAWTLVFEMYFYLVFALGLLSGKRGLPIVLASWAIAIGIAAPRMHSSNVYLSFLANPISFEFLGGVIVGFLARKDLSIWVGFGAFGLGLAAFVGIAGSISLGHGTFPDGWMRLADSIPLCLILLGLVVIERKRGSFTPAAIARLGDASYAIYLWHIPVLAIFGLLVANLLGASPATIMVDAIVVSLAYAIVVLTGLVVFRFIEKPVTKALRGRSAGR